MLVWVEDWQQQCCGDPFSVGSQVEWEVAPADRSWLGDILPGDLADQVALVEDHHETHDDELRPVSGRVERIRAVGSRSEPTPSAGPDDPQRRPLPGTSVLEDVRDLDLWRAPGEGLVLRGWLVDLRPMEG